MDQCYLRVCFIVRAMPALTSSICLFLWQNQFGAWDVLILSRVFWTTARNTRAVTWGENWVGNARPLLTNVSTKFLSLPQCLSSSRDIVCFIRILTELEKCQLTLPWKRWGVLGSSLVFRSCSPRHPELNEWGLCGKPRACLLQGKKATGAQVDFQC